MKFNVFIFLLFIMVSIPSVQAITNGDFETGDLTGWSTYTFGGGEINVSGVYAYSGNYGVRIYAAPGGQRNIDQWIDMTGVNKIQVWMYRKSITGSSKLTIGIIGNVPSHVIYYTTNSGWELLEWDASPYSGSQKLFISSYSSGGISDNYIDNIYADSSVTLSGIVNNSLGSSVSAATITLNNSGGSTTSNDTGYYEITGITSGTYTITATSPTHEDYSDTVNITSDTEKNITMTRLTPTIDNQGIIDSSESSLRIGWRENSVVDSVKIYQGTDTNLIQTENTQYISIWSYTVDNLNADTGYNFWLQPYDGAVAGAKYYVTGTTLGGGGGGGGAVPPADPIPDGTPTPTITLRPTPGPTPPPWTNITEDEWTELTITEQEYILLEQELQDKLNATGTYTVKPININLWWLILLIGIGATVYGSQKENGEFLFVGGLVTVVIAMLKLGLF